MQKNISLTTKVGLCHNLRNLIFLKNMEIDTFYPKCYDLKSYTDIKDFIEEFKFIKVS